MLARLVRTEREKETKRGLAEEEPDQGTFAWVKLILHDVVDARSAGAEGLEAVGMSPHRKRSLLLDVDEAVFLHVFVTGMPLDSEGSEVEPELCNHSLLHNAARQGFYLQRWWREKLQRGGGAVEVTNDLDRSIDVEMGAKVFDTKGVGPGRDSAKPSSPWRSVTVEVG